MPDSRRESALARVRAENVSAATITGDFQSSCVDLTADDVDDGDDGDDGDGVNTKETQSLIYCGDIGEEANYPSDFLSDGPSDLRRL
jgi:hypothetical protein